MDIKKDVFNSLSSYSDINGRELDEKVIEKIIAKSSLEDLEYFLARDR